MDKVKVVCIVCVVRNCYQGELGGNEAGSKQKVVIAINGEWNERGVIRG